MADSAKDSARLSVTPLNTNRDSSSQRASSTLTISSDDELRRQRPTGRGSWLDPSQVACRHTSDHESPSSSSTRLSTVSHEHSNGKDTEYSTEDSVIVAKTNFMDTGSERSQATSIRGYRITEQPSQSMNSHSGELLEALRDGPDCLSEAGFEPPRIANILKIWKWEVINCFLAVGLTGSMYTILQRYDGEPIPDWGAAINLSTLIALMATLLRTMLVFVASEIIGQAKWDYLASGGRRKQTATVRRLIETSRFNDASQGFLGAVKLLPTIIRDPATLMAAMVMTASLGTGSFVQQAIQTQPCQFPMNDVHASLPIARNITAYAHGSRSFGFGPASFPDILAALSSAFAPDSEEIGSPITVVCSTGNCTFENPISGVYSTLGACSACADTSSLIASSSWDSPRIESITFTDPETGKISYSTSTKSSLEANHTLPNGMSLHASFDNTSLLYQDTGLLISAEIGLGIDWAGDLITSEMKALSQWSFANITILTSNWLPTSLGYTDYIATTCTLYPCLRSYKASMMSAKLHEVLLSTVPAMLNIASVYSSERTSEEIQQILRELNLGFDDSPFTFEMPTDSQLQAIQSPCLVNDTIWTKEDKSSSLSMQRVLLLHADTDPSGGRHFTIENTTAPAECIYGMDTMGHLYFQRYMTNTSFRGRCYATSSVNDVEDTTTLDCGDAYWLSKFYSDEGATAATIIERIEAFTDRLSNKMRMGLLNDPESVHGQVLQMTVCSRIQYSWLAFPAVLVAVTNGLLAWTMFQTSRRRCRVMVWKTSILPFLFYSEQFVVQNAEDVSAGSTNLLRRHDGAREPLLDLDQMEAEARQRKVRFEAFVLE